MKNCVAIRHVAFEDLGVLAPILAARGIASRYVEAGRDDVRGLIAEDPDLLVVLGGPIGAGDDALYSFLADEAAIIAKRLEAGRAVLGICLGAQLMARALGAGVGANPAGKEIGWSALSLTPAGERSPLASLTGIPVLHWHGDIIELPKGAELLASTPMTPVQAFSWGDAALALQFHPEVTADGLESWLIGHTAELAAQAIDVAALRGENRRRAPALDPAGRIMLSGWLDRAGL